SLGAGGRRFAWGPGARGRGPGRRFAAGGRASRGDRDGSRPGAGGLGPRIGGWVHAALLADFWAAMDPAASSRPGRKAAVTIRLSRGAGAALGRRMRLLRRPIE